MIRSNDRSRIVSLVADEIEKGKLDHPGFYSNSDIASCLRSVLRRIDELEHELGRRWIPIAVGIPEASGTYLVMLRPDNSVEYTSERPVTAEFDFWTDKPSAFTIYDGYGNNDVTNDVTHWMHMPVVPVEAAHG